MFRTWQSAWQISTSTRLETLLLRMRTTGYSTQVVAYTRTLVCAYYLCRYAAQSVHSAYLAVDEGPCTQG